MIKHIKKWNEWRKSCISSNWDKLLVLLGVRRSSSVDMFVAGKEVEENPDNIILKVVTDFRYANPEYNVEWKKIRNEIIGLDELTFDINTYGQSYVRRIPAYYPSKIALGDAVRAVLIDVKAAEESWLIFKEGLQMGTETLDRGSFDGYVKEALTRAIDALPADYNKEDGHETK